MSTAIASMVGAVTRKYAPQPEGRAQSRRGRLHAQSEETLAIIKFCATPRTVGEVKRRFGEKARCRLHAMVDNGLLANLEPGQRSGLYIDARRVPMQVERIGWYSPDDDMPDDETTVMLSVEGEEEVWDGFHLEGGWHFAASGLPVLARVVAWAHKPVGPAAKHQEAA